MKKKIISIILALTLLVPSTASYALASENDVQEPTTSVHESNGEAQQSIDESETENTVFANVAEVTSAEEYLEENAQKTSEKSIDVKYTFVDSSLISKTDTIATVMEEKTGAFITQVDYTQQVYKGDDGQYKVLADIPYRNGVATSAYQDVLFTKANGEGQVIEEGAEYDPQTNIISFDDSTLDMQEGDYSNAQVQIMVPTKLGRTSSFPVEIHNNNQNIVMASSANYTYNGSAFSDVKIPLATEETADFLDSGLLDVYINDSATRTSQLDYQYDKATGVLTLYDLAASIKSIDITINNGSALNLKNVFRVNVGPDTWMEVGLLLKEANANALYVGQTEKVTIRTYRYGWSITYPTAPPAFCRAQTGTPECLENGGFLAYAGLPKTIFGMDFTFYDLATGQPMGDWDGFNIPLWSYCCHTYEPYGVGAHMPGTVKVISKEDHGDYAEVVFSYLTDYGFSAWALGGQNLGGTFKAKVMKTNNYLQIKKVSAFPELSNADTHYKVGGAVFNVYESATAASPVGTLMTNSNGLSNIIPVKKSPMYLEEIQAPEGMAKINGRFPVTPSNTAVPIPVEVPNDTLSPGDFKVIKADAATGELLSGAKFELQEWNGSSYTRVSDLTETSTGVFEIKNVYPTNQNQGRYKIVETQTPDRHTGTWSKEFTMARNVVRNGFVETAPNEMLPVKLRLNKYDRADPTKKLSDAEFVVMEYSIQNGGYGNDQPMVWNSSLQMYTFDAQLTSDNQGWFRIMEVTPPNNYSGEWVRDVQISAKMTEDHIDLDAPNDHAPVPATVELTKTDAETGDPLPGAIFNIYQWDADKNAYQTAPIGVMQYNEETNKYYYEYLYRNDKKDADVSRTDDIINNEGKYKIVEALAPEGYVLDPDWSQEITVPESEDRSIIHHLTASATNRPNELFIYKYAPDNAPENESPMEGIVFRITNLWTAETVDLTTDETGTAHITCLAPAEYTIEEIEVPDGFHKSTVKTRFRVNSNGLIKIFNTVPSDYYTANYEYNLDSTNTELEDQDVAEVTFVNRHEQPLDITKTTIESTPEFVDETYPERGYFSVNDFPNGTEFGIYDWSSTGEGSYRTTIYKKAVWDAEANQFVDPNTGELPTLIHTTANEGKFIIKELKSTPGYLLTDSTVEVQIDEMPTYVEGQEAPIEVEFDNTPNKFKLLKQDNLGNVMQGVVFTITHVDSGRSHEFTTDANGYVTLTKLPPGEYMYQETNTPAGYRGDTTEYRFVVASDGLIERAPEIERSVENIKYRRIKILKTDTQADIGREDLYFEETNFPDGTEFFVYEWNTSTGTWEEIPLMHVAYKATN